MVIDHRKLDEFLSPASDGSGVERAVPAIIALFFVVGIPATEPLGFFRPNRLRTPEIYACRGIHYHRQHNDLPRSSPQEPPYCSAATVSKSTSRVMHEENRYAQCQFCT